MVLSTSINGTFPIIFFRDQDRDKDMHEIGDPSQIAYNYFLSPCMHFKADVIQMRENMGRSKALNESVFFGRADEKRKGAKGKNPEVAETRRFLWSLSN